MFQIWPFSIFDKKTRFSLCSSFQNSHCGLKEQNDAISKKNIASNLFPFSTQCNGFDIKVFYR